MTGPTPAATWRPTAALYRCVTFAVLTIGLGLVFGRPDLAVMGIPFALGLALALSGGSRTPGVPRATSRAVGTLAGDRPTAVVTDVDDASGVQLVSVRTPDAEGSPTGACTTVAGAADISVTTWTKAVPWGPMLLARPDLLAAGADALFVIGPVAGADVSVAVPPSVPDVGALELPPILGGWAGEHRSRRAGQGGDLIDLREFAPGDRLRSIHWRAYARYQKLFVRRTQSDADTEFVLCLDTRHDIVPKTRPPITGGQRYRITTVRRMRAVRRFLSGLVAIAQPSDGPDPDVPLSSIDLTVSAATAVAAAQIRAGDRVGILDLSAVRRHVRMGSGARHLQRVRYQLAQIAVTRQQWMPAPELWGLPSSSVVVLFSPLIDDLAVQAAIDASGRGHQVIVVDVLPVGRLMATARTDPHRHAVREVQLLLAERTARLDRMRGKGLAVVSYDAGQIATDLSALMRVRRHRR